MNGLQRVRPGRRTRHLVWAVAALTVAGACATRGTHGASDSLEAAVPGAGGAAPVPATAPHLEALAPTTISLARGVVPTLVLTGSGFVPGSHGAFNIGGNTVRVGRATFDSVAANAEGTQIRFALPLEYTDTTAKGRPTSFLPGEYPVSIVTPKGTSNALTLTMTS